VNVYFAEREGIETLQLDQKTADRLRKLEQDGKLDEGFVSPDNKIKIDYSEATPALHFRVDASTSKLNGQSEQLEALQLLLEMAATPSLAQIVPQEKLAACWNKIVINSGVEDPEDLQVDMSQFSQQSEEEFADVDEPEEPAEEPIGQDEVEPTPEETAPISQPIGQPAPKADPAVEQVVAVLRAHGVPDKTIADAIEAVNNGVPAERVASQIERLIGNGR
jgi:hypothetical protein